MKLEQKTLGILGGGQLGRMSALAAARLGIKTHIFCPEDNAPASHVAARTVRGEYNDKRLLKDFASQVDVITYEFENIPIETVNFLEDIKPVYPDAQILQFSQSRQAEKQFLNDIGIETAGWKYVETQESLQEFLNETNCSEFIFKTDRMGYDGKGQVFCRKDDDPRLKRNELSQKEVIIEEVIDFTCEVSVIVARDKLGQTATYGPMLNEHKNHILSKTIVPAPIPADLANQTTEKAIQLAEAVNLVGVLALEMFLTQDGRILANEIAPRPHNSGHWTIDACAVSQFEQHVRTVCGMPVGSPGRHSNATMVNLIGNDARKLAPWLEMKNACLHLYGKEDPRPGRKMGHVTILNPSDTLQILE